MRFMLSLLLLTLLPLAAHASDELLQVGDNIPLSSLELPDQNKKMQSFDALTGEKGLVLFFVRSADWCPHCKIHLLKLRKDKADPIINAGYNIATVSYDAPDRLLKFSKEHGFEFPMLSDENSETIKAFGVLNKDKKHGEFDYGVARPHVYVIGKDQAILSVFTTKGYKKRPTVNDIVRSFPKP